MPLSPSALVAMADRGLPALPHLALPFSPDLLWRYGSQFSALTAAAAASSPANGSTTPGGGHHHSGGSGGHPHHGHGGSNGLGLGHHHSHQNTPSSPPHMDVKTHLPGALGIIYLLIFIRWRSNCLNSVILLTDRTRSEDLGPRGCRHLPQMVRTGIRPPRFGSR